MIDLGAIKGRLDEPGFDTMAEDMTALIAEVERLQDVAERLEVLKAALDKIYADGKHTDLSQFSCGVTAGIQQAVLWTLEPESWAEPISTIGLPGRPLNA